MEENQDLDNKKTAYGFLVISLVLAGWGYYVYQDNLGFTRFSITLFVIAGISMLLSLLFFWGEKQEKAEILCYDLIINRGIQSLADLASLTGKSVEDVEFNVQQLIKEEKIIGYIENGHILGYNDEEEIVEQEQATVSCSSCGAKNFITAGQKNCEYCGSPLV